MERRMPCNHKREETMKTIVYLSMLLAVLLTSTACELPPYRNVDDGLFTFAANAIRMDTLPMALPIRRFWSATIMDAHCLSTR